MRILFLSLLFCAQSAWAEMVVPTRTIRPNAIISELDVTLAAAEFSNGFGRLGDVIGQEARVALYAGQPIRLDDIGPPALVIRNQMVSVSFSGQGLEIVTEGRAMERGAIGDRIRIMNLASRATVFGQVQDDGTIRVKN